MTNDILRKDTCLFGIPVIFMINCLLLPGFFIVDGFSMNPVFFLHLPLPYTSDF